MIYAGIDYSLTSPAICVGNKGSSFNDCSLYCFTKPKFQGVWKNITAEQYPAWKTQEERHLALANWSVDILIDHGVQYVYLEGYSYGSKGRAIFNIAENTGCLKQHMASENIYFELIAPTALKKLATGKGNAKKSLMYQSFLEETKEDIRLNFDDTREEPANPTSDLVDAYWLWKCSTLLPPQTS